MSSGPLAPRESTPARGLMPRGVPRVGLRNRASSANSVPLLDFTHFTLCPLPNFSTQPVVQPSIHIYTMANKRAHDPMAGLLSEVSGLDGSLFARPSSMNAMKTRGQQQSPLSSKTPGNDSGIGMTGMQASPPFHSSSKSNTGLSRTPPAQQPTSDATFISLSTSISSSGSQSDTFSLGARPGEASPHGEGG